MPIPQATEEGCNCINCRLSRIEDRIESMQEKVANIVEKSSVKGGVKSH